MTRWICAVSVLVLAAAAMLPGCAAEAEDPEVQSAISDGGEDVGEGAEALNSCTACYVRCTNAAPSACHWTSVHNIGKQTDCTTAGWLWCVEHGYDHTWTGCSPSLHYGNCP